ncbi:hypothetical protein KY289_013299 [Solanum tuberosum]|nr:hypothetical protein KY289_013299 [Solanum tuberosum]
MSPNPGLINISIFSLCPKNILSTFCALRYICNDNLSNNNRKPIIANNSSGGSSSGPHMLQRKNTHNASISYGGLPDFGRGLVSRNKLQMGSSMSDQEQGGSLSGHSGDAGDNLYLKSFEYEN